MEVERPRLQPFRVSTQKQVEGVTGLHCSLGRLRTPILVLRSHKPVKSLAQLLAVPSELANSHRGNWPKTLGYLHGPLAFP